MRLLLNLVVVGAVLSSCNAVDETEDTPSVIARKDAVSSAGPQSLSTWRWGTPFVPSSARSAFVVFAQHPTDSTSFIAWGFDLVTGATSFFVTGSIRTDYGRVLSQVALDVSIPVQADLGFTHAIASQLSKPGPQPQPGGLDWTTCNAWGLNIAKQVQAAQLAAY